MQQTSELWRSLWASGNAWMETVAVINGTTYSAISNPSINRALAQSELSIGNVVSATCQFTVRTDDVIPKSAQVIIKSRLTNGTQTSEWLQAGVFYISHRSKDPVTGVLSLECYDGLLKANSVMPSKLPWRDNNGNVMTTNTGEWIYISASYPRKMVDLLDDLLLVLDFELDSRTELEYGDEYIIETASNGITINDVLRQIGTANGGNWIMTPQNKLRLVPVVSCTDASSATENVIDVEGVIGSIAISNASSITGIRYKYNEDSYIIGNENGIVIETDVGPDIAIDLGDKLIGQTYQAYSMSNAVYNPAVELGDYVRGGANGEVVSVLYSEIANYGLAFRGEISAPEAGEIADEYPYVGTQAKMLTIAKNYAKGITDELDESLDQGGVYNRLTNDGDAAGLMLNDGQLEFNASYVTSGTLDASRIAVGSITADKIQAGSITSDKISAGAITSEKIAADAITADMITTGRIQSSTGYSYWDLDDGDFVTASDVFHGRSYRTKISSGSIELYDYNGDLSGFINGASGFINIDGPSVVLGDLSGDGARFSIGDDRITIYGSEIVTSDSIMGHDTGIDGIASFDDELCFVHGICVYKSTDTTSALTQIVNISGQRLGFTRGRLTTVYEDERAITALINVAGATFDFVDGVLVGYSSGPNGMTGTVYPNEINDIFVSSGIITGTR